MEAMLPDRGAADHLPEPGSVAPDGGLGARAICYWPPKGLYALGRTHWSRELVRVRAQVRCLT
jgi:hypothetical protein